MITPQSATISKSIGDFYADGNVMIRENWDNGFNTPLPEAVEYAYDIQVDRIGRLLQLYSRNDSAARRAVEMFATGDQKILEPDAWLTDRVDRAAAAAVKQVVDRVAESNYSHMPMAQEFIHTMRDFPTLTLACVRRALKRLSQEDACADDCLSDVFADRGARDICEQTGTLGLIPVQAPSHAGVGFAPDGGDCPINYWRFGEVTRGDFVSHLYRDSIKWSWLLSQCAQYGGWTDEMISWILRIQQERKAHQRASLLASTAGYNTDIFNATNGNIITGPDATPNPSVTSVADAVYVLQRFAEQWAHHRDLDGNLVCNKELRVISPDWRVHCYFAAAIGAEISETATITDGETNVGTVETTGDMCLPPIQACYSRFLRDVMTDWSAGEDASAASGVYFIIPVAENSLTGRSAFVEGSIRGFETTQLAQRTPMWQTLGGRPLQQYGMDYCWNQEVTAVIGYGHGTEYPELAFASNGTDV